MAARTQIKDVVVRLLVGAGQASPAPPVGPALGSKGVKSIDFCKEFNARTSHITPGTPTPTVVTIRPDRSFHFEIRTPPTATLLFAAAGLKPGVKGRIRGAGNVPGPKANKEGCVGSAKTSGGADPVGMSMKGVVGTISLKHVYEIAKIKCQEERLKGLGLERMCRTVVAQAASCGIVVVP